MEIIEWCEVCDHTHDDPDHPGYALVGIVGRFIGLHSSIVKGHVSHPADILETASQCDEDLKNWELNLSEIWKFEMVYSTNIEEGVFGDKYHVYKTSWGARMWSYYRWARIIVNERIIKHLCGGDEATNQYKISMQVIADMANDICYSITFQLFPRTVSEANTLFAPYMTGVFLLLFPLAVAGGVVGVPRSLHLYVIRILTKIGNSMGVHHALDLIPLMTYNRGELGLVL